MNHSNAESQDGGERADNGESVQVDGTHKERAKDRFHLTVNWAAMGVLLAVITIYLTYAGAKHTWPFQVHCPVVVDATPNSVTDAHASGTGSGIAAIFWLPPKCVGSDHPISRYEVTTWRMINGLPTNAIGSVVVPVARTSITISGLNIKDIYSFHITAVNFTGPSRPAITNSISPRPDNAQTKPNDTQSG